MSEALSNLPADEKGIRTAGTPGGPQQLLCVNEAGPYRLIFASRKEEAEALKRWVFQDILPSINNAGGYLLTTLVLPAEDLPSHQPACPSSTAQTINPDSFDPTRPAKEP